MSSKPRAVVVDCLRYSYGRRVVLDDISFALDDGLHAIIGPNGAGKTTLLENMAGLRKPNSGAIQLLGLDGRTRGLKRELARQIGFLPQSVGFLASYTVSEFLTYNAWLKDVPKRQVESAVNRALQLVDLEGRRSSKMRTLSGGMVRRAGIAGALVHSPGLLLLDEPAAGLDPAQRAGLRQLLLRLRSEATVILSTHLLDDVETVCDSVVVLNGSKICFQGSVVALAGPSKSAQVGYLALVGPEA